jgi:hypothetical protein
MEGMEKFVERYLGQIVVILVAAGISSFISVSMKVSSDSELTRQKLEQLDKSMGEWKLEIKEIGLKVDQIAVMNSKLFELERRLENLERTRRQN